MTAAKTCGKCGGDDFTPTGKCRPCRKEINARYRERYPERVTESRAKYIAKDPAKAHARIRDPEKERVRRAAWRVKNKEKMRNLVFEWHKRHPDAWRIASQNRRARIRAIGGRLSKGLLEKLRVMQRNRCACCRDAFGRNSPHMDHVISLAKGGKHADSNIQLLCQPCNNAKHVKDPIVFMQSRGFLL